MEEAMHRNRLLTGMIGSGGIGALVIAAAAASARADLIVQYNFSNGGATGITLTQMETPTSTNANVSSTNLSLGSTTGTALDEGSTVSSYYTSPSPDYFSVNNSSATSDNGFYVDFTVTAASGYAFTPTGFNIVGGAGGSSNVRSFMLFDNVDGLPTSIAATSGAPTVTGGAEVGSDTPFTALRSTGVAMNSFPVSFGANVQNLNSFEVRVYFDTQLNGQAKNVDLGSLELDGTVAATPEPAAFSVFAVGGFAALRRRRQSSK
jgi:MYXO-CTERM domain-containing protein